MNGGGPICGVPVDAGWFDDSAIVAAPSPGEEAVVASFRLPKQYCGLLVYFAQYAEEAPPAPNPRRKTAQLPQPSALRTPGYRWSIVVDGRPCAPYTGFEHVVNPWGLNGFPIALRLPEGAAVQFVVRHTGQGQEGAPALGRLGGRLMGHYWYNAAYGGARDDEGAGAWLRTAGLPSAGPG